MTVYLLFVGGPLKPSGTGGSKHC